MGNAKTTSKIINSKRIKIPPFLYPLTPFFYLFFLWGIFASPYFLQHKIPYPSTYQVNAFFPWKEYRQFWGPIKNSAMPDLIDQIYPWKHFTVESWKKGEVPLWNPNSFAGTPHVANYQSAAFSPFTILFFLFSFKDAWSLLILLQPFLAGLWMYLFMKEIKISTVGSLIASSTFMFCGFMVVWMAYGTLAMAIAFLPLILLMIEKNSKKLNILHLFILSLAITFSLFSGHFQTSLYVLIFSFLFLLYKLFSNKQKRNNISAFCFFVLGILLALPQLIPTIQLYFNSVRSDQFITQGGIPIHYLVTIFAPDFFGNPVTQNNWFGLYAEYASFIGIIPLTFVFFSLLKKNVYAWFFFISGCFFLLFAIDTPLSQLLGNLRIPVLSTSSPSRIIVLSSFCFAVSSGFGVDVLLHMRSKYSYKKIIAVLCFVGILFLVSWGALFFYKGILGNNAMVAGKNLFLPTAFFFVAIAGLLLSFWKRSFLPYILCFLLILSSFDSLRFAKKWMPFDPMEYVFPEVPVISAMRQYIGQGRVYGNVRAQVDTYYNLPSVQGYDPLYIARYGEFITSSSIGKYAPAERSVVSLHAEGKYTDRVLDLLGVNLIFHPKLDTKKSWSLPVWLEKERYAKLFEDKHYELYKNNLAMKRVEIFDEYEVISDKKNILERFYNDTFDFRKKLILEERLPITLGLKQEGKAEIVTYSPNNIVIATDVKAPVLLFLSDAYYPGWEAFVNGKPTKIYRADYAFRAVIIPPGKSKVQFVYKSFL